MSRVKIGLWSDSHNFPSLPLMKLSAYHKSLGDSVELFNRWNSYDLVYASKTFSFTDDIDIYPVNADEIRKGGTGYCISVHNGKEMFDNSKNIVLPHEIEHIYPDYSLYPEYKYAVGFLTRGVPEKLRILCSWQKRGAMFRTGCRFIRVLERSKGNKASRPEYPRFQKSRKTTATTF